MDKIVKDIKTNSKSIQNLLKEKTNVIGKIQTTLDLKAHTNTSMSENQISQFLQFTDCYQKESINLQEALTNIDTLHIETDNNIYENLDAISENQFNAINSLKRLIEVGCKTLSAL